MAVVAKTACGERTLTVPKQEAFEVWPGGGDIVIEDLTTTERADQVVVADGGRYELHIFRGSYKVFDTLTKAKVADRAGWFANFSPGGRFVAAQVGSDRQGRSAFEVLDLVSGTEVANQGEGGPILGWANGDAVLVEGTYPRGELYVVASLIDYHHADRGKDAPLVFPISAAAAGRIASSWASIHFKHDLDRGVTLLRVGSSKEAPGDRLQIVEMASGHRVEFEIKDRLKAQSAWAAYAGGRPVAVSGWDPGKRIRLSHFSPDLDTVVSGMDRARALQRQYFHAHSGRASAQLAPRPEADSQRVARGDWRDSIAAILKNKQKLSLSERFTRQLADFGLTLQSSSAPIEALVERTDFDWRSAFVVGHTPRFRGDPAEIERQVLDDVPAARAIVRARNSDDMICSGEDAGGSNPIIQLGKEAFGIWRWSIGERRFWLIQTLCIWKGAEMSRVFLFFGRGNEPIRVEEITGRPGGFWAERAVGDTSAESTLRVRPKIVGDRYLLLGSISAQEIGVFDLLGQERARYVKGVPRLDTLVDMFLEADGRRVVQLNRDGQFFVHLAEDEPVKKADAANPDQQTKPARGSLLVSGRYVDDEIVLYDASQGLYWSSFEGAHHVHLSYRGLPGLFSLHQYRSQLSRPDDIKNLLVGDKRFPSRIRLPEIPPSVDLTLSATGAALVTARASSGLGPVYLYLDGWQIAVHPARGVEATFEIPLPPIAGAKWLTAVATDVNGFSSQPVALATKSKTPPTRRLLSVAVGVDAYDDPGLPRLQFAGADARKASQALAANRGGYYASVVSVPVPGPSPAVSDVVAALEQAVQQAKPEDTLAFFYAGHGVKDRDGRLYITTTASDLGRLEETALSWTRIAGVLDKARARVVVFLDACHSGQAGAPAAAPNDQAIARLFEQTRRPMIVFAASKGRQLSFEAADSKLSGGYFTQALADIIAGNRAAYDLDGNGAIEVSELYRGLKTYVIDNSNGDQTPWLARQDVVGDFALF